MIELGAFDTGEPRRERQLRFTPRGLHGRADASEHEP
jgi:hypothetical protein